MNITEVAKYLSISHKTVRRYVRDGKLKVVYIEGKGVYDPKEVEALKVEKQTPIHRAIVASETEEPTALSQFVSPDIQNQIIQLLSVATQIAQYYELQCMAKKLVLTLDEATVLSGFSRSGLRQAIKAGELRAVKQGGRWRVRSSDLVGYVEYLFGG